MSLLRDFKMGFNQIALSFLLLFSRGAGRPRVNWNAFRCSSDAVGVSQLLGRDNDVHHFPWLGIIQHSIYIAEKIRYAVTAGILIHPGYVLASAEDISKIPIDQLANNTKFILWNSNKEKYALEIHDYSLHPDFTDGLTVASLALLQLRDWASGRRRAPADPICVPFGGFSVFENLYAAKIDDGSPTEMKMRKLLYKINYVDSKECQEFYYKAQLTYSKMAPRDPLCASVENDNSVCVWDSGTVLMTANEYNWMMLGFGVRGPGCGAPARYIAIHRQMEWIEESILARPLEDLGPDEEAFFLRQHSPQAIDMYRAEAILPEQYGTCGKGERGRVLFKDKANIRGTGELCAGYYSLKVAEMRMVTCMELRYHTLRSRGSMWVEHSCHKASEGKTPWRLPDRRKFECYVYYKTTGIVEFRFVLTTEAEFKMTLYGVAVPQGEYKVNPWAKSQPTDAWYPTWDKIRDKTFEPWYVSTRYL